MRELPPYRSVDLQHSAQPCGFQRAERRRSRTYQPLGYNGLPVLKTGWATGPVPLQVSAFGRLAAMVLTRVNAPERTPEHGRTTHDRPARTTIQLIGGPTALLTYGGLRILTDPTFDPPGDHPRPGSPVVLHKLTGPAAPAADVLPIDLVLLSHDHHADNLDPAGRAFLPRAARCSRRRPEPSAWAGTPSASSRTRPPS